MSGRQAKIARREIRRSAESGLRTMQEQQENAIMACLQRVNAALSANQVLTLKVHELTKRVEALEPKKAEVVD